ncbi:hypothetical protein [Thalassotalea maritima]|uniref:hypothetical protein n=1 Tax=Thalassotalea maritima TaxID=3242416 RepID=UPI003528812B
MKYTLSFGFVYQTSADIAELIPDNNTLITAAKYDEYRECIKQHFSGPYGVVINLVNTPDFDDEILQKISLSKRVVGIALVHFWPHTSVQVQRFTELSNKLNIPVRIFNAYQLGRQNALNWIELQLVNSDYRV